LVEVVAVVIGVVGVAAVAVHVPVRCNDCSVVDYALRRGKKAAHVDLRDS